VAREDANEENADLSSFTDADAGGDSDATAPSDDDSDATADDDAEEPESTSDDTETGDGTNSDTTESREIVRDDAERPREETVELGLELLAHLEDDELELPDAMDRIETVTTDPTVIREILDTAETRGIIDREGATIRTRTGGVRIQFDQQVVRRKGDYDCRRCGKHLSTGHFVQFDTGELGPFGSSCIEKVTGRD
jgi:hypothetical protein